MHLAARLKLAAIGVAFACPVISGCLGGFAYPTAAYIPRVSVSSPAGEQVHAFRVDIIDFTGSVDMSSRDDYRFRELTPSSDGAIAAQAQVRLDRGWWGVYHTLGYLQRRHATMRVRLYRPGYETVEIKPWEWHREIAWKEANTIQEQEKAIDDLISTIGTNDLYKLNPASWSNQRIDANLAAPTKPAHRDALAFVAREYERLANRPDAFADTPLSARLRDKARQMQAIIDRTE